MPATAGRVRMPANNRVHSSAALQTHGIWQSAIGYDPYAPENNNAKDKDNNAKDTNNAYNSFQDLLALARLTTSSAATSNEPRGACKKCGRVGHLTFQCRNFLTLKPDETTAELPTQKKIPRGFDDGQVINAEPVQKIEGKKVDNSKGLDKYDGSSSGEEEESESDDSDEDSTYDSEIERILAERSGKSIIKKEKQKLSSRKNKRGDDEISDGDTGSDKESRKRRLKRRSSRKRKHYLSDDSDGSLSSGDEKKSRKRGRKSGYSHKRRHRSDDSEDSLSSEDECKKKKRNKRVKRRRSCSESEIDSQSDSGSESHRKRRKHSGRERRRHRKHRHRSCSAGSAEDESRRGHRHHRHRLGLGLGLGDPPKCKLGLGLGPDSADSAPDSGRPKEFGNLDSAWKYRLGQTRAY